MVQLKEDLKRNIINDINSQLSKYKITITDSDKNTSVITFFERNGGSGKELACLYVSRYSKDRYVKEIENISDLVYEKAMECLERVYALKQKNVYIQADIGKLEYLNIRNAFMLLQNSLGKEKMIKLVSKIKTDNKFTLVKMSGDIVDSERSNYGIAYKWKMKIEYKNKQYTFSYTNSINASSNEPTLKDCLYSLISDRGSYLFYEGDIEGFRDAFCSDASYSEVKRIYNSCERTSEALERVFGDDLEWFEKELQDY